VTKDIPVRVLDEVADAVQAGRGGRVFRPVVTAVGIADQFGFPVTGPRWAAMERRLGCPLPPLDYDQGHWWLPPGLATVWDLVDHVARCRPELEPPAARTAAAWREAQVFAGVRETLVDALNIGPADVTRRARLRADLGADA
jgi:hypothetical protein